MDLFKVLRPNSLSSLNNGLSDEVGSISVVNECRDLGGVVLAGDDHNFVGNLLNLKWRLCIGIDLGRLSGKLCLLSILEHLRLLVKRLGHLFNLLVTLGFFIVINTNVAFLLPETVVFRVFRVMPRFSIFGLSIFLLGHLE